MRWIWGLEKTDNIERIDVMKVRFVVEVEYTEKDEKEFGNVESFIEEIIDQNIGDFSDVDSWEVE